MKALSLRPHWAWLVVNGYKDIENRSWPTKVRGRIWVHSSSKPVSQKEYEELLRVCGERPRIARVPEKHQLKRGGIVGSVDIVDCVAYSRSRWFLSDYGYGFVLKNARKTRFRPYKGALRFFEVN